MNAMQCSPTGPRLVPFVTKAIRSAALSALDVPEANIASCIHDA